MAAQGESNALPAGEVGQGVVQALEGVDVDGAGAAW